MTAFWPLFTHPSLLACTPFLSKPQLGPASAFSIHSEHRKNKQTNKPFIFPAVTPVTSLLTLHTSRLELTALLAACYLMQAKNCLSIPHNAGLQHPALIRPGAGAFQRPTTSTSIAALPHNWILSASRKVRPLLRFVPLPPNYKFRTWQMPSDCF